METTEDAVAPARSLERLEAEITELAGHLAAGECRWLLLIGEYDRRSGYEAWGCRNCAAWLSWHCGLDPRAARERVRVARALEELPLLTHQFGAGILSYSKVRALTRIANPANEADLVTVAAHATAVQVERAVRAYRTVQSADQETGAANTRHAARFFRYDWGDDGSLVGHFRIPPEMGAILLAAIARARDPVPTEETEENGPAGPTREIATTNCDALIRLADTFLTIETASGSSGDRFQIVVNVDSEVLDRNGGNGECELDGGPALAPETVRRLACDASIVDAVLDPSGRLMGTRRKRPAIPAAARRAVHARDRGCRFPGCGARVFTNVHHIRHRARRGGNEIMNLVELCWFHHRLVHEGGWNVRFDSGGSLLAIRPNGNMLPRPENAILHDNGAIERENRSRGVGVDPTTCIPQRYGDRFDLDEIVAGLIATEPPARVEAEKDR